MKTVGVLMALAAAAAVSPGAHAQNIRPGRWEWTHESADSPMTARIQEMRWKLDELPPAER